MRPKTLFWLLFILAIAFVTVGDRVLPGSLAEASKNTRTSINNFLIGLVPKKAPNLNEDREKQVENLEKGSQKSEQ